MTIAVIGSHSRYLLTIFKGLLIHFYIWLNLICKRYFKERTKIIMHYHDYFALTVACRLQ